MEATINDHIHFIHERINIRCHECGFWEVAIDHAHVHTESHHGQYIHENITVLDNLPSEFEPTNCRHHKCEFNVEVSLLLNHLLHYGCALCDHRMGIYRNLAAPSACVHEKRKFKCI